MLAMQYSFTLPADYDMAIIRARIAANGHRMDGYPRLGFKAYLHANRDPHQSPAGENLYAPFYLWEDNQGINDFLASSGFAALTSAFGWPSIRIWSVWESALSAQIADARWASREILRIEPYTSLEALRDAETRRLAEDMEKGAALGALVGFEPGGWTLVRFRLWENQADLPDQSPSVHRYQIGHLSSAA